MDTWTEEQKDTQTDIYDIDLKTSISYFTKKAYMHKRKYYMVDEITYLMSIDRQTGRLIDR
jgi:hypothetical protein